MKSKKPMGEEGVEISPLSIMEAPCRYSIALMSCSQPFFRGGTVNPEAGSMLAAIRKCIKNHKVRYVLMAGDQMYSDMPVSVICLPKTLAKIAARLFPEQEDFSDRWSSGAHIRDRNSIHRSKISGRQDFKINGVNPPGRLLYFTRLPDRPEKTESGFNHDQLFLSKARSHIY